MGMRQVDKTGEVVKRTNNYFKFVSKHRTHVHFEFFDNSFPAEAEKAFAKAMQNLEKFAGTVAVWAMPGYSGKWVNYKVKEVGQ